MSNYRYLALVVEQESMVIVYRYTLYHQTIPSSTVTDVDHSLRTIPYTGEVSSDFGQLADAYWLKIVPPRFEITKMITPQPMPVLTSKCFWMHKIERQVSMKRSAYISSVYGSEVYRNILETGVVSLLKGHQVNNHQVRAIELFKKRYQISTFDEVSELVSLQHNELQDMILTTEEIMVEALHKIREQTTLEGIRELGNRMMHDYKLAF